MKNLLLLLITLGLTCGVSAQQIDPRMAEIQLLKPNLSRGKNIMQALSDRHSTRAFADRQLGVQDLSELLWAANGVNRPESGKRTAPSAGDRRDIRVYVCMATGNFLYDPDKHVLIPISPDELRPVDVPLCLVLVSDGNDMFSGINAGIVSQNISLYCAGVGLGTYPRGTMDRTALQKGLQLTGSQTLQLCHPIGYPR